MPGQIPDVSDSPPSEVEFLHQIDPTQLNRFGGKAVNLATLHQIGVLIPRGFTISTQGYNQFQSTFCDLKSYQALHSDLDDIEVLLHSIEDFHKQARDYEIPEKLTLEIQSRFEQLLYSQEPLKTGYAVRSSATVEDTVQFSFAGQADSFLCVKDLSGVLEAVKKTWLSLYSIRSLLYMKSKGINLQSVSMAVIVQEMILGEISGVVFTANVVSKDLTQVLIDSTWGLGESIVAGKVIPDSYVVQKTPLKIMQRRLGEKALLCIPHPQEDSERTMLIDTPAEQREVFTLSDGDIMRLAKLAMYIENQMGHPQDIEWTLKDGQFVILQTRPITTL
ncbi:MAG: PEP/pyruvate-binding domain-containing protein [Promethearchaeota archaeon]